VLQDAIRVNQDTTQLHGFWSFIHFNNSAVWMQTHKHNTSTLILWYSILSYQLHAHGSLLVQKKILWTCPLSNSNLNPFTGLLVSPH